MSDKRNASTGQSSLGNRNSKSIFTWDVNPIEFRFPEDVQSYFLEGQCPALAYELYALKGWTIAMVSDQPAGSDDYIAHVFVIDSDGMALDIKGRRSIEQVKEEWYFAHHLHRFFSIQEFKVEMREWDCSPRFDRDPEAKLWARKIVELL